MRPARTALLLPLLLIGCDRPAPPPAGGASAAPGAGPRASSPPAVNPPAPTAGDDVADLASPTITLSGVKITWPKEWRRVAPANPMRKAELRLPAASGSAGEDCIAAFSQAGGTIQWNLDRWATQVVGEDARPAQATTAVIEVNGVRIHTFASTGAYQDGMPGADKTPRTNWTLRGAVLETTPNLTFIKMWGPAKAMADSQPAWDAMLQSITKVQ